MHLAANKFLSVADSKSQENSRELEEHCLYGEDALSLECVLGSPSEKKQNKTKND